MSETMELTLEQEIENKIEVLNDLYIYDLLSREERKRIQNVRNEIELENIARTLILKYL